ncbi:MAG TPA: c-type cytochrome [Terriglobales bacterium]|nr:c-type cytochrome [Terriglobales bacterium]
MNLFRAVSRVAIVLTSATLACFVVNGTLLAQSADDLYNKKCAVCHAKDGSGNTAKGKKVHVKDVHENMKDSEAAMIKVVTDGKGDDMDSYKGQFTADQIKALVEYYRSLGQK